MGLIHPSEFLVLMDVQLGEISFTKIIYMIELGLQENITNFKNYLLLAHPRDDEHMPPNYFFISRRRLCISSKTYFFFSGCLRMYAGWKVQMTCEER